MKDYELTIKVKNNYLLTAMRNSGIETASELSKIAKVIPGLVGDYLNLKQTPYTKKGDYRPSIIKIAEVLNKMPNDLFPEQHLEFALETNVKKIEVGLDEFKALTRNNSPLEIVYEKEIKDMLYQSLDKLSQRDKRIIDLHFGLTGIAKNFSEIGKIEGISSTRARQIVEKTITRLRYPALTSDLRKALKRSAQ